MKDKYTYRPHLILLVLFVFFVSVGCSTGQSDSASVNGISDSATENEESAAEKMSINSYEECIEAGFPVLRSMPPKCATPDGRVFSEGVSARNNKTDEATGGCKDLCGDGRCQQMVCQAVGCPCAENPKNCPADCASPFSLDR